jgi:hypothetical protein
VSYGNPMFIVFIYKSQPFLFFGRMKCLEASPEDTYLLGFALFCCCHVTAWCMSTEQHLTLSSPFVSRLWTNIPDHLTGQYQQILNPSFTKYKCGRPANFLRLWPIESVLEFLNNLRGQGTE